MPITSAKINTPASLRSELIAIRSESLIDIAGIASKWVEAAYNVKQWTEMPRGGHFAAMEEPKLFVEDVRKFFRTVR